MHRGITAPWIGTLLLAAAAPAEAQVTLDVWWHLESPRWLAPANLPTPERERVLPQALAAFGDVLADAAQGGDLHLACEALLGLARCAPPTGAPDPEVTATALLAHAAQPLREAAALALGASGRRGALAPLVATALDDATGRELAGGAPVAPRSQVFALYGLGLLAAQQDDVEVHAAVVDVARRTLDAETDADHHTAAVLALLLVGAGGRVTAHGTTTAAALAALSRYVGSDRADPIARSFVPSAIARLAAAPGAREDAEVRAQLVVAEARWERRLTALTAEAQLLGATAAAIGTLHDGDAAAAERWAPVLIAAATRLQKERASLPMLLAMGQLGGPAAQAHLLRISRESRWLARSWATAGLGLAARRDGADEVVREALRERLADNAIDHVFAAAIAIGLSRTPLDADLQALAERNWNNPDCFAGACDALQLLGEPQSITALRPLANDRKLGAGLEALARGLAYARSCADDDADGGAAFVELLAGLLSQHRDDRGWTNDLIGALGSSRSPAAVAPLLALVADRERPMRQRAQALWAASRLCERDVAPWHVQHRDAFVAGELPPTLIDGRHGVLDRL